MSHATVRASVLFAAFASAAVLAAPAVASPVRIADGRLIDASSDGRYALIKSPSGADVLLHRDTGAVLPVGSGTALQLADHSQRVLVRVGDDLFVRDFFANTDQQVNLDEHGARIDWKAPHLVLNGTVVFFETTEADPRILRRDVASNTTLVRLEGAHLTDASEDGRVIGWRLDGPTIRRPTGSLALPSDAPGGVRTHVVGYQFPGQPARAVAATTWTQEINYRAEQCASSSIAITGDDPYGLGFSVDPNPPMSEGGISGARYRVVLGHQVQGGSSVPGGYYRETLLTADGLGATIASGGESFASSARIDPVSGAIGTILDSHASSGVWNSASVTAADGSVRQLHVTDVPSGTTDYVPVALYSDVIPFNGGAGVLYTARPRDYVPPAPEPTFGVYVDEGPALGPDATDWLTLPRDIDGGADPKVTYADCGPVTPVAGAPADYATITPRTTGNSAGSIAVHAAPAGKIAAKSVTATLSWFGLPLWTRAAHADTTMNLPAIAPGIPGFKVGVKITLTNGTVLSESAAVRRAR